MSEPTSIASYHQEVQSGKVMDRSHAILHVLAGHHGMTARAIWEAVKAMPGQSAWGLPGVSPRMAQLVRKGKLHVLPASHCPVTGKLVKRWALGPGAGHLPPEKKRSDKKTIAALQEAISHLRAVLVPLANNAALHPNLPAEALAQVTLADCRRAQQLLHETSNI